MRIADIAQLMSLVPTGPALPKDRWVPSQQPLVFGPAPSTPTEELTGPDLHGLAVPPRTIH